NVLNQRAGAPAKALEVVHAPRSSSHVTKSPSWPASPIAERALIDIVATRDFIVLRNVSASVGVNIHFALSPDCARASAGRPGIFPYGTSPVRSSSLHVCVLPVSRLNQLFPIIP